MIDLHTHVLYGVDDGAESLEESKKMIMMAYESGTRVMVATSHFLPETFPYQLSTYEKHFDVLKDWIEHKGLEFKIYKGQEVYLDPVGIKAIREGRCLSINKTRYILVELTNYVSLNKINEMLDNVTGLGYIPIIAHVERLRWVLDDMETIHYWIQHGYILQVNASSIMSKRYKDNYKSAHKLLSQGLVHIVASDGHRLNRRRPKLKRVQEFLCKLYGDEGSNLLLNRNPQHILNGHELILPRDKDLHKRYRLKKLLVEMKGV